MPASRSRGRTSTTARPTVTPIRPSPRGVASGSFSARTTNIPHLELTLTATDVARARRRRGNCTRRSSTFHSPRLQPGSSSASTRPRPSRHHARGDQGSLNSLSAPLRDSGLRPTLQWLVRRGRASHIVTANAAATFTATSRQREARPRSSCRGRGDSIEQADQDFGNYAGALGPERGAAQLPAVQRPDPERDCYCCEDCGS